MARQQQLHRHRRIKIGAGIEADEAIEVITICKAIKARAIKGDMDAEADMVVVEDKGKIKAVVMAEAGEETGLTIVNKAY